MHPRARLRRPTDWPLLWRRIPQIGQLSCGPMRPPSLDISPRIPTLGFGKPGGRLLALLLRGGEFTDWPKSGLQQRPCLVLSLGNDIVGSSVHVRTVAWRMRSGEMACDQRTSPPHTGAQATARGKCEGRYATLSHFPRREFVERLSAHSPFWAPSGPLPPQSRYALCGGKICNQFN